ncbi:MAG: cache domain-containing protein, partial [Solidesulfovibrio magneticus str. Maddingley MBC34]
MKRLGLNQVLTIAVLVSLFCGIAGIIGYTAKSTYDISLRLEQEALERTAKNLGNVLELYIDTAKEQAQNLAAQPAVAEALAGSPQLAQAMLRQYVVQAGNIASIMLLDSTGKPVAGALRSNDALAASFADRDYFKAVMDGRESAVSSSVMKGKTSNTLLFAAAHAVKDQGGKTVGVVVVCPSWDNFMSKYLDPVRFGDSGYAYMLDGQGRFIAHAKDKSLLLSPPPDRAFADRALALKNGVMEYDFKGEHKFMAVAQIAQTGWLVCMTASESEMAALASAQRNVLLVIGTAVLVLVAGLIIVFNKVVVLSPLAAIAAFAAAVA